MPVVKNERLSSNVPVVSIPSITSPAQFPGGGQESPRVLLAGKPDWSTLSFFLLFLDMSNFLFDLRHSLKDGFVIGSLHGRHNLDA